MDVTATAKYVRLSPSKARDMAKQLRGLGVADALKVTDFGPRKAAKMIGKALKSAIANAEHNAKLSVDELTVKEALVDGGPTFKRFWARARGGASPVTRKTCHIKIVLTDGQDVEDVS